MALVPADLGAALGEVCGPGPRAGCLVEEALGHREYCRRFAFRLAAEAAGSGAWELRCLATLLLQHQVSLLPCQGWEEQDFLFLRLGIKSAPGREAPLAESVLREGFSTRDLEGFSRELQRRLARGRWALRALREDSSQEAWRDFLAAIRRPCKLVLARWLLPPDDVVRQIVAQVRTSRGLESPLSDGLVRGPEAAGFPLPEFEARILGGLREAASIYWTGDATGGELNGLVENPLTTVVLTVKPPGSDLEIEIKRTGWRGGRPLGAVFRRKGENVPVPHRLQGGSMGSSLRWDATHSALWAAVYRKALGAEAPLSRTLALASVQSIPGQSGDTSILDYFTQPRRFGKGFTAMRRAMREAVAAFDEERQWSLPELTSDLGWTVRFLAHVAPAQALLVNTSSFRLDRMALYLSGQGPEAYFSKGLGVPFRPDDARRLADEVLEEVLGIYEPPCCRYQDHEAYVAAALAVPANRQRADETYRDLARQAGLAWGTLLALGGWSNGESFVGRNVGLRSVFRGGDWRVEILFIDHDGLQVGRSDFLPSAFLAGAVVDERYLLRSLRLLQAIYRPAEDVVREAGEGLRSALALAFRGARAALNRDPELKRAFSPGCRRQRRDWERLAGGFLRACRCGRLNEAWRERARQRLVAAGYRKAWAADCVAALDAFDGFLDAYEFLCASVPGSGRRD